MTDFLDKMPSEGRFFAMHPDGSWHSVARYDNPFGKKNTVWSDHNGRWFTPVDWFVREKGPTIEDIADYFEMSGRRDISAEIENYIRIAKESE
jgi:hypothetical protein